MRKCTIITKNVTNSNEYIWKKILFAPNIILTLDKDNSIIKTQSNCKNFVTISK